MTLMLGSCTSLAMLNGESKQQFASFLLFYENFLTFSFICLLTIFSVILQKIVISHSLSTPVLIYSLYVYLSGILFWLHFIGCESSWSLKNKSKEIWRTLCFIVTILALLKRIWQSLLYFLNKFQWQCQINLGQTVLF